jgi:hypothetical protein
VQLAVPVMPPRLLLMLRRLVVRRAICRLEWQSDASQQSGAGGIQEHVQA